jgi:hypothetical protein
MSTATATATANGGFFASSSSSSSSVDGGDGPDTLNLADDIKSLVESLVNPSSSAGRAASAAYAFFGYHKYHFGLHPSSHYTISLHHHIVSHFHIHTTSILFC